MKLKKYNQMFEKEAKDIFPEDYLDNIKNVRAGKYQGSPSHQEIMENMGLIREIARIQHGNEDKLTQIGKDIIKNHYGSILDDVNLDIKIVEPDDEEKMDMTRRMNNNNEQEQENDYGSNFEVPINVDENDVSKRKIANIIMQGEAQNVHSMMYTAKEEIDKIDPHLLDLYSRHLEITKKMDWDENRPDMSFFIEQHPEFANAMEVQYPEGEENEEDDNEEKDIEKITIKARVLDLPMLIHETVKGIYELMTAKAIPEDPVMAEQIMKLTDTLDDEQEDIKYGPYIAADIRNYINNYLDEFHKKSLDIENIREFVFSEMIELESETFVNLIKSMIIDDKENVKRIFNQFNIIESAINNASFDDTVNDDFEEAPDLELPNEIEQKEKSYADMTKSELDKIVNQALEDEDYETLRKVKPFLGD